MKATSKKQKQHYVDNQEFLLEITRYQRKVRAAAEKECPEVANYDESQYREFIKKWKCPNKPRVGNYLGSCFLTMVMLFSKLYHGVTLCHLARYR